ncbi:MAG: hypothetical protein ACRDUV_10870 [Pseudonocardiaceae bacterium]
MSLETVVEELGWSQTEDYAAEILRHSPYTPLPDEAAQAAELASCTSGPARRERSGAPGRGD